MDSTHTDHTDDIVPEEKSPQREQKKQSNFLVDIFRLAVLALLIVVPFRMFVAQPFIVSGASMSPTFETGQYLIVDQLTYHLEAPKRGDVIIFRFPEDPSKFFIKRVIGLPNETVELRDNDISIREAATGKEVTLTEPYLRGIPTGSGSFTLTLGPDEYFVMGDNRGASSDSRIWGPVPSRLIIGRALIRLLPFDKIGLFPGAYTLINPQGQGK